LTRARGPQILEDMIGKRIEIHATVGRRVRRRDEWAQRDTVKRFALCLRSESAQKGEKVGRPGSNIIFKVDGGRGGEGQMMECPTGKGNFDPRWPVSSEHHVSYLENFAGF
jgi:hypothetical protein